jgi:hypothetical protein
MANTAGVTDEYQIKERQAFTDWIFSFYGFVDRQWPTGTETKQHYCFENSHFFPYYIYLIYRSVSLQIRTNWENIQPLLFFKSFFRKLAKKMLY